MQVLATRWVWLRRLAIPIVLMLAASVAWAGLVTALAQRLLGITTSVDGNPLSFTQTLILYARPAAPLVIGVNAVAFALLALLRRHVRWWVLLPVLGLAGTPIGVWVGWGLTRYLWSQNRPGGLSDTISPAIALLAVWVLGLAADAGVDALGRRLKRRRVVRGICVRCGYDLRGQIAAGCDICSECGQQFDLSQFRNTPA